LGSSGFGSAASPVVVARSVFAASSHRGGRGRSRRHRVSEEFLEPPGDVPALAAEVSIPFNVKDKNVTATSAAKPRAMRID
jgi:hypothetical protein